MLPEPACGREAIIAGEQGFFDAFVDIPIKVRTVLTGPRRVIAETVLSPTNDGATDRGVGEPIPATGRRIEVRMAWLFDLDDDGLMRNATTWTSASPPPGVGALGS